jgi:carbonic anhydrase
MKKLLEGLHRFQSQVFAHERGLYEELAKSQSPETLFITCSDSRLSPNQIVQCGPGMLFTLRNAGNIVPAYGAGSMGGEGATIEFAVRHLQVKDIIVCGHSGCGAVSAVLNPALSEKMPLVRRWLGHCDAALRAVEEKCGHLEGEALHTATVQENVLVQLDHLRTYPEVRARLARGDLALHGWMFNIGTGDMLGYASSEDAWVPLKLVDSCAPGDDDGRDIPAVSAAQPHG